MRRDGNLASGGIPFQAVPRGGAVLDMTFFTFDDHEVPPDTRDVLAASSVLQITEFRLFELAYLRWFGVDASPPALERQFAYYMFAECAPFWVRQFCRDVLERDRDGALDPLEFGVVPVAESDTLFRRGVRYGLILLFLMTTLHLVAFLASRY